MKSFSLCQDICPELIPVKISKCIGDGADGEVFEIENLPNSVIKFSILYEYSVPIDNEFNRILNVLSYLKNTPPSTYARVLDYKFLTKSYRTTVSGKQSYILYYYIMEKCLKISDDEKKVFHTILSHEDRGINKNYSLQKIKTILEGLNMGLDFDIKKVYAFYKQLSNNKIIHNDIHPRNIMKNKMGDFCLIDFDRCDLYE